MPNLYHTPASIGYLTQFILSLVITGYLVRCCVAGDKDRSPRAILLASVFAVATFFTGLLFLDAAALPAPRLYLVYIENTVLGVLLILLIQFAYRFPVYFPHRKWEARLAFGLSVLYTTYEAGFAVYRFYLLLWQNQVEYRLPQADYALTILLAWVPIAFLRQSISADKNPAHWVRRLWQPQGLGARGARTFTLTFILLLALSLIGLLEIFSSISSSVYSASISLGILAAIWMFAMTYLNVLPENTSFLVKLSGVTLTLLLAILGLVGWAVSPGYLAVFHPTLTDYQTLRFTPNLQGGYDISPVPFNFEMDLGERLMVTPVGMSRNQRVAFTFPFYGKEYSEVYVTSAGMISLGQKLYHPNLQFDYAASPGIFPLLVDLDPRIGGGVFARNESQRLIVTWYQLPAVDDPNAIYTFQVVLYKDGVFEITYNGLPTPMSYSPDARPSASPWLRGITSGIGRIEQVADLSLLRQSASQGSVQDFYLSFRYHLDQFLAPLAWLIVISSLLIILGLPALVNSNLIKPLNALLEGIHRAEAGDLSMEMPIQYHDEIGSLTSSFNVMTARLRLYVTDLEQHVDKRTQELRLANTQLKDEAREREQTEEALKKSEVRYRAVTQSANDAVISSDSDGEIIGWNRGAELIFGYSETEVMGQSLTLLMPQHFRDRHLAGMERVVGGGEPRIIGKTVEMQGLHKSGSVFAMEMSLAEWRVDDAQFYTAIIRNITERKQAEETLLLAQHQVIEQQRALATFDERERVARELHDGIGQILGYVNIQTQAVRTLLDNSQIAAVRKNLEDITQVVQAAHANLRHTILGLRDVVAPQRDFCQALSAYLNSFHQAWGIETVFSPPQEEIPALPAAVEDQLLHIIQEALVNIRKHAEARRVEVLISLNPGEMNLIISDDGRGFDPQLAPCAEKEHFGLSIMRERAEQIGGQLDIRAAVGHGTRIFIYIPINSPPAPDQNIKDVYSLRILLVDDQPLFLDGMRNLLTARGLTIIGVAHDGLEAFEQVKDLRPDIVLMDVHMPKCDGIEATRLIKTEFPETKVVLLTVSEDDEYLLDAIKYGASSYLLKNLDANQLFSMLDGLAHGEIQVAPELVSLLLKDFNRAGDAVRSANKANDIIPAEISMRQWEVLRLVARGLTYKEVGRELHLTEPAIKYHMAQILDRLQLKNREQAVAYLREVEQARKKKPL